MTQRHNNNSGFSLFELLVTMAILTVVLASGSMLFISTKSGFSNIETKTEMQNNIRQIMSRISYELQESGENSSSTLQVSILDNTGVNNTDQLRFAVPLCLCGELVLDSSGEVQNWGAPTSWGDNGCGTDYTVVGGNVDICYVPPSNPSGKYDMSVPEGQVAEYLAEGSYIGNCSSCNPDTYTNRWIQYQMDANGNLNRLVLDSSFNTLSSSQMATQVNDFQAALNAGQNMVTLTLQMTHTTAEGRVVFFDRVKSIKLRNL